MEEVELEGGWLSARGIGGSTPQPYEMGRGVLTESPTRRQEGRARTCLTCLVLGVIVVMSLFAFFTFHYTCEAQERG